MPFAFKTILIPVDFSINTEVAINKALELAEAEASIHLVHVLEEELSTNSSATASKGIDLQQAQNKMEQWKNCIGKTLPSSKVHVSITAASSVQEVIEKKVKMLQADLVVIGKNCSHTWFPFLNTVLPGELAEKTNTAVLTVKPGSLHNKIRTVVVPVTDDIPYHKMEILATLCKKFKVRVYLATFCKGPHLPESFSASPLLKTYQWLKNVLHCQVEYSVLHGHNKARTLLTYSEKIQADILLLNPRSETKIGWTNLHISDVLPLQSKVRVLTVQPN